MDPTRPYPAGHPLPPYTPPPPGVRVPGTDILAPGASVLPGANPSYGAGESPYPVQNLRVDFTPNRSTDLLVLELEGDWIWLMDVTDTSQKIRIYFDRANGPYVDLYRGGYFSGVKFKRLFISHQPNEGVIGELLIARQYDSKKSVEAGG